MSCSDTKKTKKRKSNQSGNMGDVLGKECGDSEKDEVNQEICAESVREEADGAASGDEQTCSVIDASESKEPIVKVEDENCVDQKKAEVSVIPQKEEKLCGCDACKERRELAAEQQEEMRRLQSYWLELRQYIRMVYRMAMEGTPAGPTDENEAKMKELVQKLCLRDPHQLFQRLESQVQEFVIEAKVRQLELLHREEQTSEVAQIFLRGLLEGFEKLCRAAKQLSPLLHQLEIEHLRKFNLTWEVLNKHLYQTCVYTDPLVQTNLPLYIGKLRNIVPGESDIYTELVHKYLLFDDEMTLIGAMWRDAETLIHEYNQEQATLKAKQRMLREDWELFKAQRKLIQQKMWNKTASELREFDEQLMNLASLAGSPESPRDGSPDGSGGTETAVGIGAGFCLGCSSHRGCPCDECAMTHLLTCGGLITPPDSPGTPLQTPVPYSHKESLEYRPEGEGSEQPPVASADTKVNGESVGGNRSETEMVECAPAQQQSCECHVCTAPLISPDMPSPGSSATVNLNLHTGGFHLYPHIHGTGGGGDASSLYPHLYNIHPSLLSQLGSKHSRLGAHIQDQIQLTGIDLKAQHLVPSSVLSVADLLPAGLTLETIPSTSNSLNVPAVVANSTATVGFSAPAPLRPKVTGSPNGAAPLSSSSPPPAPLLTASPSQHPASGKAPDAGSSQQSKPKLVQCQEQGTSIGSAARRVQLNSQSSASTQTSPNKASNQQKVSAPASAAGRQVTQGLAKRVNTGVPQTGIGGAHPTLASSHSSPGVTAVRHSTTQTASSGPGHNSHISSSLPDVVKSTTNSTTPNRPPVGAGKLLGHSCHKNHKHPGNADGEVIDMEDSSSQDDTCSERSSSTTTSTQRDSRHCDCCYCEVFGHGVPSVAPVSRNYQEMRERLRLLLTKKKAKCKMNAGTSSSTQGSSSNAPSQPSGNQPTSTASANAPAKPPVPPAAAAAAGSLSPASSGAAPAAAKAQQPATSAPPLTKQDSADSVSNSSKDPRDLEALLDFIEGNQSGKCTNMKKAAKKARQKQKKLEEKEKKEQEEAERLRGLEALQNSAPEVTITVVNTPGDGGSSVASTGPSQLPLNQAPGPASKGTKGAKRTEPVGPSALPAGTTVESSTATTAAATAPQMVTIKRVMEPNGAEPTVTITLKGATPDMDKVLFTLVNGQVCQSQEESKPVPQASSESSKTIQTTGKKKKGKGNNGNSDNNVQPQNPPPSSKGKNLKSQSKAPISNASAPNAKNNSNNNTNNNNNNNNNCNSKQPPPPVAPAPPSRVQPVSHLTGSAAAIHLNGVSGAAKGTTSVTALRTKVDAHTSSSFSLENLKLPPGITITKVDGPTAAAAAQRRAQMKAQESPKPPPVQSPPSSTTIIAAPTAMGGATRISGYGQAVNGSNVIVVDTGRMKEELESTVVDTKESEDRQNSAVNGKKKKKKKTGNGNNENEVTAATVSGPSNKSQQKHSFHGVQVNGKHANNQGGKSQPQVNGNPRPQSTIQYQVKQVGCSSKSTNPLMQPAIIKVNGSMVTIRNPALQQAMSAGGPRLTQHMNGHADVQMNGDVRGKSGISKVNKKGPTNTPLLNGITSTKGKENNVSQHFASGENSSIHSRSHQAECNGVGNMRVGKMIPNGPRSEENGITLRGGNSNSNASSRMRPLQQQIPTLNPKVIQKHPQESPLQHTSARAVMQAHSAVRDAMAAATDAKKNNKKKKKKGPGGQGHADDWTLVESVFAPKDIDLENGDIDDDERELEAFKRFCFNSVPPKRKEKVHLNIKDIVLKKKSSAIGCS